MLSVVVWIIDANFVVRNFLPPDSVSRTSDHAISRDVVYGGNLMVVGVGSRRGGSMRPTAAAAAKAPAASAISGEALFQRVGGTYTSVSFVAVSLTASAPTLVIELTLVVLMLWL